MGLSIGLSSSSSSSTDGSHYNTHKAFLLSNYILIGAASSCIFLTLSLRLIPAVCGLLLIFLHVFTIIGAISGCTAANAGTSHWYATHMVVTVLTAIFQGSVAVFVFTRTSDFLGGLKSYVREEDGEVILKLAGGLCILIFCMEWMVLGLAFLLRYYDSVEGEDGGNHVMKRSSKVQHLGGGPWAYQA